MPVSYEFGRDTESRIYCIGAADDRCEPHFHSNIEVTFVREGEISCTVNGLTRTLPKGWICAANSYDIHCYDTPLHSRTDLLIVPMDMAGGLGGALRTKTFAAPFAPAQEREEMLTDALTRLREFSGRQESPILLGYVYVVLGVLMERLGLTEKQEESTPTVLIRGVLQFLEDHFLEEITLEGLARRFGYNKDYFSRMFHSCLGYGLHEYVNNRRARYAAQLIASTPQTLEDISYQGGFHNFRTFSRAFQAYYHMRPTEYRKKYGK